MKKLISDWSIFWQMNAHIKNLTSDSDSWPSITSTKDRLKHRKTLRGAPPSEKSIFRKKLDFEIYIYSDSPCRVLQPGIICFAKTCTLVFFSNQVFVGSHRWGAWIKNFVFRFSQNQFFRPYRLRGQGFLNNDSIKKGLFFFCWIEDS